jgi:hypothetical protein
MVALWDLWQSTQDFIERAFVIVPAGAWPWQATHSSFAPAWRAWLKITRSASRFSGALAE